MSLEEAPAFFDNATFTEIVKKIDSQTPLTKTQKNFRIHIFKNNGEGFFAATHFDKKPNENALEIGTVQIKNPKYSIRKILEFFKLTKTDTTQEVQNSVASYSAQQVKRFLGNNAEEVQSTLEGVKDKTELNLRKTFSRPWKRLKTEKMIAT